MASSNRGFEVTSKLEYFSDDLKSALIKWCDDNHYQYAFIVHGKDLKHNDDTNEDEKVDEHLHFLVNTGSSKWGFPVLEEKFKKFGLTSVMLQKLRKGWNNALSYLIHRTDSAMKEGKHLYEPGEVTANFDYVTTIGVIENQVEEKRTRIDEVLAKIDSLECRRYNIHEYISLDDYAKKGNKFKIDMAFQYVETRLRQERKGRNMKVFWIYGESGIGKSTLAKYLCEKNGWSYAISSSSNDPLQDYEGQDVLILDDFRSTGWTKADVLKMLDNNTASSIKSRYQNKQTCYLRAIIITTTQSPAEFWSSFDGNFLTEDFMQLKRRITFELEMYKDSSDGQFARVYFKRRSHGLNGMERNVETIDFTDILESIKMKQDREFEDSVFSGMKVVENVSHLSIDSVRRRKIVDESDVPVTVVDVPF